MKLDVNSNHLLNSVGPLDGNSGKSFANISFVRFCSSAIMSSMFVSAACGGAESYKEREEKVEDVVRSTFFEELA